MELPNLRWLSTTPGPFLNAICDIPVLSFLSLEITAGDEIELPVTAMTKIGTNLRRIELRNLSHDSVTFQKDLLRYCPKLDTLVFDFLGFNLPSSPANTSSSISTIVLVIKEWTRFQRVDDILWAVELDTRTQNLAHFVTRCLPKLSLIYLSFSRLVVPTRADLREELTHKLGGQVNIPVSVVFF